ncbi:MAG: CsbD family protein [Fibrobacteres bacterium]|nr:CsbD family protein [Fibrobacterota bacterium]
MKSSTRDKVEGAGHEVKGIIKQSIGKLSNNPKLVAEGTVEKVIGKIQRKTGQVKNVFEK